MKTITIDGYHDDLDVGEGIQLLLINEDGTQKWVSFEFEGGTYSTPQKAISCLLRRISNKFKGYVPDYYVEQEVAKFVEEYYDEETHRLPSHKEAGILYKKFLEEDLPALLNTMAENAIAEGFI